VSETRDELEREIGARRVGTLEVGGRPMPLALPASEDEVVALLRLATRQRWRVLPVGSGSKVATGPAYEKARFALSVRGLTGITAYERGDGTITARAGNPMSALAAVALSGGNHLTPDVADAPSSTLGGTLASGTSGIDRLRFGPVRNHVLGMRVALADGTLANTGGKLVKNVTGYDLHRLYTGSRGALCVILEASLRLFPAPERIAVIAEAYFGRDAALAAAAEVLASPVRPLAVCVENSMGDASRWTLHVALAGRTEPVAWEQNAVASIVGTSGTTSGGHALDGREARARIEWLRDLESGATVRLGALPARLPRTLAALDELCAVHGVHSRLAIHPGVASVVARLILPSGETLDAARLIALSRALQARGIQVTLLDAPLGARRGVDALANASDAERALTARLKNALDPNNIFVGARFDPVPVAEVPRS
jgi:glycolate oxidase FAD binding subunit